MRKINVANTRYMNDPTIEALGIINNCRYLLDRIGWQQFIEGRWDTYMSITLEFLSNLRVEETNEDDI